MMITSEFSNLFDNLNTPVVAAHDNTIVYCNPAAEFYLGEIMCQPVSTIFADNDAFDITVSSAFDHSIYYLSPRQTENELLYHVSARLKEKIAELKLTESIIAPLIENTYDEKLISYSRSLKKTVTVLHRMVGNLGYFQSFDKSAYSPTTFDLARTIGDIADSVPVFVGDNCPAVIFECGSDDMTVAADKNKIELAVFQLLSNSLKHTEKDGTVKISLTRTDKTFTITVADSGCGMNAKQIASSWTPGNVEITPKGGIGVGLPMVQSIAALHGGHAVISSGKNGTTVSIIIPAEPHAESDLGNFATNYDSGLSDLMLQLSEIIPTEHFSDKFTD